ncbi:MAG: enterochelin esterase [Planctomycetaceae bacterium]|nr:enterochelin esterase [Planctomycetaceae bacterium]
MTRPLLRLHLLAAACVPLLGLLTDSTARCDSRSFQVEYVKEAHKGPFTGRVYLIFSKRNKEPRRGPGWFNPEQFVARDVQDWHPGVRLEFSGKLPGSTTGPRGLKAGPILGYPGPLAAMQLEGFHAQAVTRFNPNDREIGQGAGNGFSMAKTLGSETAQPKVAFSVSQLVPARPFRQTRWGRLLKVNSALLTAFYKRPVFLRGGVILPASYYEKPERRYPVIFTVPGFGGTHHSGSVAAPVAERNDGGVEFLRIILDPSCPLGHHVFADSANNGPVGQALTTELIPALDKQFRTIARPSARFLTGHSSGGWSSLWLQVTYPNVFAGTWSTAPDPVDFRDFQRINLYRRGENMYTDGQGRRRPLARVNGQVRLWYKGFADMEWVLGHGGQLHSFEAVFSPRGSNGRPRLVWDRADGKIDLEAARTWEKYDIRLVLQRNWKTLGPKLKGKLHVFMGDTDTFYLEGATIRLKAALEKLGSDAVVEIHKGSDHFNLFRNGLRQRIRKEMTAAFLAAHPDQRQSAGGR